MTTIHTRQLQQYTKDNYNNTHGQPTAHTANQKPTTTCRWLSGAQVVTGSPLTTCAPDGHLQSVTIPDAV